MYLLETLTAGMYNEPLSIFREYIQNSVDSIDKQQRSGETKKPFISIKIDPIKRKITFKDNGGGIKSGLSEEILGSIGVSQKRGLGYRGFRGIGRLGGLAFSKRVTFKTKAKGESVETIQEWDCEKLRNTLQDPNKQKNSIKKIYFSSAKIYKQNKNKVNTSQFIVILKKVSIFRNYIFDITQVIKYLQETVPLPFDPNFTFGKKIEFQLSKNVINYNHYDIILNGEKLFKPYNDVVKTSSKLGEEIEGIDFLNIETQNDSIAFGWIGKRSMLLGSIANSIGVSGIRVREGYILSGDSHLLDNTFREARFNSYLIGEIHVIETKLIPNSRRDNFIDNKYKSIFFNEIEKKIGLPFSKQIRLQSRLYSEYKEKIKADHQFSQIIDNSIRPSNINDKMVNALTNIVLECEHCRPKILKKLSEFK